MPDLPRRRVTLEIPWRTLLKLAAFASLIWLWLQLVDLILVMIVAVLLAVTFNPVVTWLEQRGLSRAKSSCLVAFGCLALIGGFLWLTWSSLAAQARYAVEHISEFEQEATRRMPSWMRDAIGMKSAGEIQSYAAPYALRFVQSTMSALTIALLGFVITIYLLIEGRATRDWLVAFVPLKHRGRTERTLAECERVVFGYVTGNAITSLIAFACTLIALWALKVPAALLLAVMAGISDFVPVIGFFVTMVPAVLLALTVSGTTALLVTAFYIAYNTVENYFISPWAYGGRLRLSNLAVILAFVIGAEVAGVIGALIALPIAAIYPSIEEIWLREKVGPETVREHTEIEQRDEN
jgi:predicted PurR-regulated permease PerM